MSYATADKTESQGRQADCHASSLESVTQDITDVFTKHIRTVPACWLMVASESNERLRQIPLTDAIDSAFDYPETDDALMQVLQFSDCPHVQALRVELAKRYVQNHASDIADVMAQQA